MRVVSVMVLISMLAACSGQPTLVNTNKSPAETRADYDDCQGQAAMAAALTPKGKSIDDIRQKALDECMKAKGYVVK
jgi:uncharacterized lipoprotein YajG